jgi:hypothetical protein
VRIVDCVHRGGGKGGREGEGEGRGGEGGNACICADAHVRADATVRMDALLHPRGRALSARMRVF